MKKKLCALIRTLVVDARLAVAQPVRPRPIALPSAARTFDHPTYLRRGIVIAGVTDPAREQP